LQSTEADGVWTPTDYKLDPAQAAKASISVFDRAIPASQKFETCAEVSKRMAALGAQPIVSGKLIALELRATIFVGQSGNRI
jgi:hypothetical protein